MRVVELFRDVQWKKDWSTGVLLFFLAVVSTVVLTLPFSITSQRMALNRFHFQTPSFTVWAFQQTIPAMYTLENSFDYQSDGEYNNDMNNLLRVHQLNHFPMRVITFFDYRQCLLRNGADGFLTIRSRYQNQFLETHWRVQTREGRGFDLISDQRQTSLTPAQ